jgi:hypothetical protein
MNRLCPAETRLKEGALALDSEQTGGSVPLPRVGGALSAHCPQYQGAAASLSNAATLVQSVRIKAREAFEQRLSRLRKVATDTQKQPRSWHLRAVT